MLKINVVNKGHQPLPQYATVQSAGMDLRANLDEPVTLRPLERCLVPTGLHIALPEGYEAQIRPRSGLALNSGIAEVETTKSKIQFSDGMLRATVAPGESLTLYNMKGEQVFSSSETGTFDLKTLTKGVYIVKVGKETRKVINK